MDFAEKIAEMKPLRDLIFEHLKQQILDGVIKPEDRLIERDIADQLTVSRTPVREALRRLESEGYVEYVPRKGVVVRGFNVAEIEEIYEIRKALECLAVRQAILNSTEADIARMKEILAQWQRDADRVESQFAADGQDEFDAAIIAAARMPMVKNFIHVLRTSLMRYRKINLSRAPRRKSAMDEHKAILQAIIDRDEERAVKATTEHIDNSRRALFELRQVQK